MRLKAILSATCLAMFLSCTLAWAEIRFQEKKDAAAVASGKITDVKGEKKTLGKDGMQIYFTFQLKVASVEKGAGIKAGDTITIKCYTTTKHPSGGFVGAFGHRMEGTKEFTPYIPKKGDEVKVWLNAMADGAYPMLYPYGHEALLKPKPGLKDASK